MRGTHTCAARIAIAAAVAALAAIAAPALGQRSHQFDGGAVQIPAGAPGVSSGPGAPYPSTITVGGLTGLIDGLKVRLKGLSHTYVSDLDVLLVGPGGQTVLLLNRVGGSSPGVSNADFIFSDDGTAFPIDGVPVSGRYRPTQRPYPTAIPAPAPAPPYGTTLAGFRGTDPNGTWSLYVLDNASGDFGELAGWSLFITEAPSFVNSHPVAIPGGMDTIGPGDPYPSTVVVDGLGGTTQFVAVSLLGLTHTFSSDIRILLVGPTGQSCVLYSYCGADSVSAGVNLIIDDHAATSLPHGPFVSGMYRPTVCLGSLGTNFSPPAPPAPYGATLSVFNGTDPNGEWRLYAVDDAGADAGALVGGWALIINGQVCPADFNHSGVLSVQDIFDFLAAYFAGCP